MLPSACGVPSCRPSCIWTLEWQLQTKQLILVTGTSPPLTAEASCWLVQVASRATHSWIYWGKTPYHCIYGHKCKSSLIQTKNWNKNLWRQLPTPARNASLNFYQLLDKYGSMSSGDGKYVHSNFSICRFNIHGYYQAKDWGISGFSWTLLWSARALEIHSPFCHCPTHLHS